MIRRRVLLRCDGGDLPEIGTGHVVRCLALARELAELPGSAVAFCMRAGREARRVGEAGFEVFAIEPGQAPDSVLLEAAAEHAADVVALDDLGASGAVIPALRAAGRVVVAVDDPRTAATADLSWTVAFPGAGATFEGLDRTVLLAPVAASRGSSGVLASFGGYDPADLCGRFLRAWRDAGVERRCTVAVGAGHAHLEELRALAATTPGARVVVGADLAALLPDTGVALTNGGTTMLLCAAFGVPSLAVAQYEHQLGMAQQLEDAGAARTLGLAAEVDFDALVREAVLLLDDEPRRAALATAGRCALPGLGRRDAVQTLALLEELPWDSNFFGRRIATLHPRALSPRLLEIALERCEESEVECLYFLCDAAQGASLALARDAGFLEVDERVTYARTTTGLAPPTPPRDVTLRRGRPADAAALAAIAGDSYGASRYYHDPNFPAERCRQFYRDWILRSLEGRFDDAVLVAEVGGEPVGYVSCRALTANLGSIGLLGIAEACRGRGLGARLANAALAWCAERDLPRLEVVTQGRNAAARRLYESTGFALSRREVWFHKWFDRSPSSR